MKRSRHIVTQGRDMGPIPLMATLNSELSEREEQLASYRIGSSLASNAILPMYLEVVVDDIPGENIPELFGRAYDLQPAPLYQSGDGYERHPGSLFFLPTPLKMGIQAVGIRQLPPPRDNFSVVDLDWSLHRVDLYATQPAAVVEKFSAEAFSWISPPARFTAEPVDPNIRVHLSGVGELAPVVPLYTPNDIMQRRIEKSMAARLETIPTSVDKVKEIVPGIILIHQIDGVTLRESTDWLIGHDFALVARHLGVSTGAAKGLFTRLLRHVGNQELNKMKRQGVPPNKLEKRSDRTLSWIDSIAHRTGTDLLFDVNGRNYIWQVALERDRAHEIATQIINGRLKLPGVGPAGIEILRHVFDVPDV